MIKQKLQFQSNMMMEWVTLNYLKFSSDNNNNSNLINQGLEVFIDLKLNNKAELEIIFDENSGSKLSGRGEGDFRFESDYSGNFNIIR